MKMICVNDEIVGDKLWMLNMIREMQCGVNTRSRAGGETIGGEEPEGQLNIKSSDVQVKKPDQKII